MSPAKKTGHFNLLTTLQSKEIAGRGADLQGINTTLCTSLWFNCKSLQLGSETWWHGGTAQFYVFSRTNLSDRTECTAAFGNLLIPSAMIHN